MEKAAIKISGEILEGGGQILRISSALSCILAKPICISNIRAKRSKPGLRPQHLAGIQLVGEMCSATLRGDTVNSVQVELRPTESILGGGYVKEVGTAGSLVLLLQSAFPVALFSANGCELTLGGGTNAESAPPIDYFTDVFMPTARLMGIDAQCELVKRGFYPKGGGQVKVNIPPISHIKGISLVDRGEVLKVTGISYVAGQLPLKVAERAAKRAIQFLRKHLPSQVAIDIGARYEPANRATATGCGIFITAVTSTNCIFGGTGIGKKGKSAEDMAQDAAEELLRGIEQLGCVDEHLQDQLVIFMALASGPSKVRCGPLTLHTETAIHIAHQLTGVQFNTEPQEDGTILVSCEGIGHSNNSIKA